MENKLGKAIHIISKAKSELFALGNTTTDPVARKRIFEAVEILTLEANSILTIKNEIEEEQAKVDWPF